MCGLALLGYAVCVGRSNVGVGEALEEWWNRLGTGPQVEKVKSSRARS